MTNGWKVAEIAEYVTLKEAQLLIAACPKERDRLLLQAMWETGGRVREALQLTPDKVDPINKLIYLPNLKQLSKTKRDKGMKPPLKKCFLFPESTLCRDLLDYCAYNSIKREDWVFQGGCRNGQVSATYVWLLLADRRPNRRAGLAVVLNMSKTKLGELRPVWPHLFRHGAGMYILKRTGRLEVVQKQLGHTSIMNTEVYAGLTDEDRKEIIDGS